jgi:flagellar hook assembly protein FlgD
MDPNGATIKFMSEGHSPELVLPLKLYANSPNPFSVNTTFKYDLPKQGLATIKIYNVRGQVVNAFVNNASKAGSYKLIWDGKDEKENRCACGVYFYRIEANGQSQVRKMLLLK